MGNLWAREGGNQIKWSRPRLPTSKDLSSLPDLMGAEAGVKGCVAGKGGSGDSWSGDKEAQPSEGFAW